jgi:signal transduction histidine kinase
MSETPFRTAGTVEIAALKEANLALEARVERLGLFIRALVHDLRTPLTPLLGAGEMLADGIKDKPWSDLARSVAVGAAGLQRLLNEMSDLEKCESGMLAFERAAVDAGRMLADIVIELRELCRSCRVEIALHPGAGLPRIHADPVRLHQAFTNLLTASVKNTPAAGTIDLAVTADGERLTVSITDRGVPFGLGEDTFELYPRPAGTKSRASGLSTYYARRVLELHGGKVFTNSAGGQNQVLIVIPRREIESGVEKR